VSSSRIPPSNGGIHLKRLSDFPGPAHYNAIGYFDDSLLVGIGSIPTDMPGSCPMIFQIRNGKWAQTAGDNIDNSWGQEERFSRNFCKYIYIINKFRGDLIVGTSAWTDGGQPEIWRRRAN
jgi:hypothetical protein